jgi:hypothetical protein
MRTHPGSTALQRNLVVAVPLVVMAGFAAVPTVLSTWNFFMLAGLLTAFGWIARTTYLNGLPTGSVGQLLYDTERSASRSRK